MCMHIYIYIPWHSSVSTKHDHPKTQEKQKAVSDGYIQMLKSLYVSWSNPR